MSDDGTTPMAKEMGRGSSLAKRICKALLALPVVLALVLTAIGVWGFFIEPSLLVVKTRSLTVPGFPSLRVALISDLHAGAPFIDAAKIRRVVAETNAGRPDLVLLLGDFVIGTPSGSKVLGGHRMKPDDIARLLSTLSAPRGVYAVLGNHDRWVDAEGVERALERQGIRVLDDEARQVGEKGAELWIAGINDIVSAVPRPDAVVRAIPLDAPILAFTHSPDVFPKIPSRVALTVAGHTHGGQVRLPFLGPIIVPSRQGRRFASGLIAQAGHQLYVTSGIGTSILPVRIGVPPEIVFLDVNPPRP